ncbi:MAG: hypothetical protein ICV62_17335 [Cyanobacteria bacterium Co-bin13]|nr:hypothetical protein [Cyanobacteria bacterium Co-bin13]
MATQPTHPFQNSSAAAANNGVVPMTPARMALDNLLRRELKVSDPNDSKLVAEALLTRYKDSPRAIAIQREAQGVPFLTAPATPFTVAAMATSSDAELQQAIDDVNRDLQELTTNTILKDVTSELQGWALAIRSAIAEGTGAARFALEARQKDKAFAIRRQLSDYARMARLVGTLTPGVGQYYRKLAQSLDEVASVLLVKMGEALAGVGFSGGRFLLQVPYTELQVRRDAVIYALQSLTGATQAAYGQNDWPRGLDAYRQLFNLLEVSGQSDLRSLLLESELSRIMDELIQRAAHGTADGLRALGATAHLDLERFRRLIFIGRRDVNPESPPLTSFLLALQLFADAFEGAGGFRLLRIARPPILFYGLYGIGGMAKADQRLLQLVIERGLLAEKLDCFMQCCGPHLIRSQIILDKLLYDLDRAIDLYALGTDEVGEPEIRAAAYSYLVDTFLDPDEVIDPDSLEDARLSAAFPSANLRQIQDLLRPSAEDNIAKRFWEITLEDFDELLGNTDIRTQELCVQRQMESRWKQLLQTMAPNCANLEGILKVVDRLISDTISDLGGDPEACDVSILLPPTPETSWNSFTHGVSSSGKTRKKNL